MDLQQIKYFLAVVDFGTFLAASEQAHVSQPTLSSGIRKLEESLNVKLFHRGSRAATLTTAGELFLTHARQSYNQLMSVKSKLAAEQDKITIGVLNTIPMAHVAEIIRIYQSANAYVFIEVVVDNHERLAQMLHSRKLDMIFTTAPRASAEFTVLFKEHLNLVASVRHPLAGYNEIELEQLSGQPFIERMNCESWGHVHGEFNRLNIKPYSVCRAEDDESVLSLVAANLGVSMMPVRVTPYEVKFIKIKNLNIARLIGLNVPPQPLADHVQILYETILGLYKKTKNNNRQSAGNKTQLSPIQTIS